MLSVSETVSQFNPDIVTPWLKVGIVEKEEAAIARQRSVKQVSAATNQHLPIEEVLEAVFCMQSTPRLYSEDQH
jgi:hypothetical protein